MIYVYICDDEQVNKRLCLTYLKKYKILNILYHDDCFILINDNNILTYTIPDDFIPLYKYRKIKINNILKCLKD